MISLYLKYRPQNFDDLVDQDVPKRTLRNAVSTGRVSHAYLFCGPRGTGKTSTARILAKALVCASPQDGNPCGTCFFCEAVSHNSLVDIIEIDAASNRGIDEIRALKERIAFAPTQAAKKVYIIDEVHMLTKDAFNALLKTLEEPPSHVHFILATTEVHKVLDTIISRCQRYDFRRISLNATTDRLEYIATHESITIDREALELIAVASQGGLRDAIRTLEQLAHTHMTSLAEVQRFLGHAGGSRVADLIALLLARNTAQALALVEELYQQGVQMRELAKEVIFALRERMVADIEADQKSLLGTYIRLIEIFDDAKNQLKTTVIESLPLELACIKSCEELSLAAPVSAVVAPAPVLPVSVQEEVPKKQAPAPRKEQKKETPTPQRSALDDLLGMPVPPVTPSPPSAVETAPGTEISVSVDGSGALSLELVQKEWKKFADSIEKSSVKFCLREGRPSRLESGRLTVSFPTRFSMEKVLEASNRELVHGGFRSYFQHPLELVGEVANGASSPAPAPVSPPPAPPSASAGASDVLSVFGGSELL